MTSPADTSIAVLRANHDALAALVADLDDQSLAGASSCSDWDLSQVLGHLGSGAEIARGGLRQALDPAEVPPSNEEIWDRWNSMEGPERRRGYLSSDEALVAGYEALDDATRNAVRFDLGFLPEPVDLAGSLRFRLNEASLHSWDVRSMFDPAATLPSAEAGLLLEHVSLMLPWIAHADAIGRDTTVAVTTSEPASSFGLAISVTGNNVSIVDLPDSADGTLSLPSEAWVRLVAGRLPADRTPESVSLVSDVITLADLRRVFRGF